MAVRRMDRVNQLLLEEVARVVQNDLSDPHLGFVTVVSVRTASDLSQATVFVSVLGSEEQKTASLAALERAAAFVRSHIAPHLHIRSIPRLHFQIDDSAERAERISRLLKSEPGSAAPEETE